MQHIIIISPEIEKLIQLKALLSKMMNETQIITATTVNEGLFKIKHLQPEVILMHHIFKPEKQELFLREYPKCNALYKIPLIMLVPYQTDEERQVALLEHGVDIILPEPIHFPLLKSYLQSMLRISHLEKNFMRENSLLRTNFDSNRRELKKSDELLRKIYQSLPIGVLIEKRGSVFFCNKAFEELIGLESRQIIGKSIDDFFPSWSIFSKQKHKKNQRNTAVHTPEGELPVEMVMLPIGKESYDGRLLFIVKSSDLQRQSKTDESLLTIHELNNRYNHTRDFIQHLIKYIKTFFKADKVTLGLLNVVENSIHYHTDGPNDEGTVIPNYKTLASYALSFREAMYVTRNEIEALVNSHEIESYDKAPAEWLGLPLVNNGRVLGILELENQGQKQVLKPAQIDHLKLISNSLAPIIDAREKNLSLQQALEKAKKADRLKTHFLSNISHEVRTPLNAIIGFSSLLEDLDNPEEIKEYAGLISSNGDKLVSILDNLVELSKIESGELKLNKMDTNIYEIFQSVEEEYQENSAYRHKNIILNIDYDRQYKDIIIKTDPYRIKEILLNLLDNAYKFTEEGRIDMGYRYDGSEALQLYVQDSGIGIPPDKQESIFEQFVQVEEGDIRYFGGTGIGLTITKKIVELLGGELKLSSTLDQGTRVEISLPAEQQKFSGKVTGKTLYDWNGKKILLVDDVPSNLEYLDVLVRKTGAKTYWAGNGEIAIKQLENHPDINLILMDIQMPVMDGYTASRIISNKFPGKPIIAQTAFSELSDKKKALESGAVAYLQKPINPRILLQTIEKHLS